MKHETDFSKVITGLKIALVHDWLTGMRGGEMCLEILCDMFPTADIFTLIHNPGSVSKSIESHRIYPSFLNKFPLKKNGYRNYLPLFPTAIEQLNLKNYDVVISTSHAVAKGVIPHAQALHISYLHTPMRYVWDLYEEYFGADKIGLLKKIIVPPIANYLRTWDVASSNRVDYFLANSHNVKKRIWRHYRRESEVIYPPVKTNKFTLSTTSDDYFLVISAFVPYKRIDLAIEAANRLQKRLIIVGNGPEEKKLHLLAGSTVEFKKAVSHDELTHYYQNCIALLFPGEEDFGIVPLEAQSCGKPVIAFGKGGALETVKHGITGLHFNHQSVENLCEAMQEFSTLSFDPETIREHAIEFDENVYRKKMTNFIHRKIEAHFQ